MVVDLFRDKFKSGKIINKLDLEKQKEGKLKNSRLFNSWMGEIRNKKTLLVVLTLSTMSNKGDNLSICFKSSFNAKKIN